MLYYPGSKTTIADLIVLQRHGRSDSTPAAAGGTVLGICGGFQILGEQLVDPQG